MLLSYKLQSIHREASVKGTQKAILPGIIIGSVFILMVSFFVASPRQASAATAQPPAVEEAPVVEESEPALEAVEDGCVLAQSYPDNVQQWCGLIEQYAGEQGLDANLVAAVILQESGGHADAYSHSGAVGLMQIMPRDGIAADFTCVNGPCFASRPSMAELFEPEFNITFGTRFLAGLIQKHGNLRDGLAAYGPGNAGYSYADKVLAIYESYR